MSNPNITESVSTVTKDFNVTKVTESLSLNDRMKNIPQSSWNDKTKYLVLIGYYDYDVSWVNKLKVPHIIYYKDMPDKAPYTARNKAKGETNLLKFIIDFYDKLPEKIINVHQYEHKWYHRGSLVPIINRIPKLENRLQNSKTPGFLSINDRPMAILGPTSPDNIMKQSGWWDATMEPYFGDFVARGDFTGGKSGCSQFIVKRENILRLPLTFYRNMYDWLCNNIVDEEPSTYNPKNLRRIKAKGFTHPLSNHCTSRYLEWTWELIFTGSLKE